MALLLGVFFITACNGTDDNRHIHEYVTAVTAPTCTAEGYTTYTCQCGFYYTGDYTDPLGHELNGDACTRCDYVTHKHVYEKTVVSPTCTEKGYTEGVCTVCGATFRTDVTEASGHTFEDGKCIRCGYEKGHEHSYEKTVVAATCTEKGYTVHTCLSCGDIFIDGHTQPFGHDYVDGVCARCGSLCGTAGLVFAYAPYGYICTGIDSNFSGDLVIPSEYNGKPVKAISGNAFSEREGITSVTINNSITNIGAWAFNGCKNMRSVKLPDTLLTIGAWTFNGCERLKEITIPDGVGDINEWAFYNCTELQNVKLPDSLKYLGQGAFANCGNLKEITIPDKVTEINERAFANCKNLSKLTIGKNVEAIKISTFLECALTNVVIPDKVTEIGEYAFANCKLETVTIGNGVEHISGYAFYRNELLTDVYYNGIIEEWLKIKKDDNWAYGTPFDRVICLGEEVFIYDKPAAL